MKLKDGVEKIDGQVWKRYDGARYYKTVMPLLDEYEFDFLPKIVGWNNHGYMYEYIDKPTINDYIAATDDISQQMILEIKMAMDDIWKELYKISLKHLNEGDFLYYNDPNLDNLIWDVNTKKLILLDIDSFEIGKVVPISFLNNYLIQNLESHFIMRKLERRKANEY